MRAAGLALALSLASLACGGGAAKRPPQTPAGDATRAGDARDAPPPAAAEAAAAPLTDDECDQLADHLVDVSLGERRAKPGASAEPYTAEDAEAAKRELRQSLRPACPTVPRRDFTCAMAARSSAELGACQK